MDPITTLPTTALPTVPEAVPAPRPEGVPGRHEGHRHPADLSEADDDMIDAAHEMYPEAAYALEHCHCFHEHGPDHPHVQNRT
jgi:hypothetical protein